MKGMRGFVAILILVSTLAGCSLSVGQPARDVAAEFDRLARYVPAGAEFPLFFDLKPEGAVARHWDRVRARLEVDASGRTLLDLLFGVSGPADSMLGQFKAEELGLMDVIEGPAVAGRWEGVQYAILQVSSEREARDALIRNLGDASAWEQKTFDGRTLYNGEFMDSSGRTIALSWTTADGMLFLTYRAGALWFDKLEALLSLDDKETMAAVPAWHTLRNRLPEGLIAASFVAVEELTSGSAPPSPAGDPLSALPWYIEAVMIAGVPQPEGVRISLDGTFKPEVVDLPEFQALLALPPVDVAAWTGLPPDTAVSVVSHDAATIWTWMRALFGGGELSDTLAAGPLEALVAPSGPLSGAFAVAILPPLPAQPVFSGTSALQFLAVSPDTARIQVDALEEALQGGGGTFADDSVEGVPIRRQVGPEVTGYAPAYGFDEGVFYLGSSPESIGKALVARREDNGLVVQPAYQAFLDALPHDPFYVVYVNGSPFLELLQANMPVDQSPGDPTAAMGAAFDGIGFGLTLTPERLDGVLYFVLLE